MIVMAFGVIPLRSTMRQTVGPNPDRVPVSSSWGDVLMAALLGAARGAGGDRRPPGRIRIATHAPLHLPRRVTAAGSAPCGATGCSPSRARACATRSAATCPSPWARRSSSRAWSCCRRSSPGKLLGIGLNYRDHAAETGAELPREPLVFAKLTTSITGPAADVVRPGLRRRARLRGRAGRGHRAAGAGRRPRRTPSATSSATRSWTTSRHATASARSRSGSAPRAATPSPPSGRG